MFLLLNVFPEWDMSPDPLQFLRAPSSVAFSSLPDMVALLPKVFLALLPSLTLPFFVPAHLAYSVSPQLQLVI